MYGCDFKYSTINQFWANIIHKTPQKNRNMRLFVKSKPKRENNSCSALANNSAHFVGCLCYTSSAMRWRWLHAGPGSSFSFCPQNSTHTIRIIYTSIQHDVWMSMIVCICLCQTYGNHQLRHRDGLFSAKRYSGNRLMWNVCWHELTQKMATNRICCEFPRIWTNIANSL